MGGLSPRAGWDPHSSVTCASVFGGFAAKFAEACQDPIRFLETRHGDPPCVMRILRNKKTWCDPACVMRYKSADAEDCNLIQTQPGGFCVWSSTVVLYT